MIIPTIGLGQQMMSLDGREISSHVSLPNGVYLTKVDGTLQKVVVIDGRMLMSRSNQLPHHMKPLATNGNELAVSLKSSKKKIRLNEDVLLTVTSTVGQKLQTVIAGMPCDGRTPLVVRYMVTFFKGDPIEIGRLSFQRSIICTPIPRRRADPIYDVTLEDETKRHIVTPFLAPPAVVNLFDVSKKIAVNGTVIWGLGQDWPHRKLEQKWQIFSKLEVQVELRGAIVLSLSGQSGGVSVTVFRK